MSGGMLMHGGMKGRDAGLPFAGIPPEVLALSGNLFNDEPDYADLSVDFSHVPPTNKSFSLWQFLAPYKFRMLGAYFAGSH